MRFDPSWFPKYDSLTIAERLFLRTCCYLPPRPRRQRKIDDVEDVTRYVGVLNQAFGPEFREIVEGRRVLELGCGGGEYVLALAKMGAGEVVGVDIQRNFDYAEAKARACRMYNVSFLHGTIDAVESASVDVVISHDSFEHFDDPGAVLSEMVRILRPGGRLLIKFGPTWPSPWGRHMSGTIRRDRPWVHLVVPERLIMRCHSVYHDKPELLERFSQLPGGLNKMTPRRFTRLLRGERARLTVDRFERIPLWKMSVLTAIPVVSEYFTGAILAEGTKRIASAS